MAPVGWVVVRPLAGVTDGQVVEHEGFWWVRDKGITYFGIGLKS